MLRIKKNKKHIFINKSLWSGLILIIYMFGRNIPLPFVNYDDIFQSSKQSFLLVLSGGATGANLSQIALFSLGLGPWMSAMIIWQLLVMVKRFNLDKLNKRESDFYKNIMTLGIAIIEALGMLASFNLTEKTPLVLTILVVIMSGGTFFLVWLANINSEFGIGGSVLIVFFGMIGSMEETFIRVFKNSWAKIPYPLLIALGIFLIAIFIIVISIMFERSEYRIKINRILVNNSFGNQTYLPIKLNPCGAMAIMFGLSILMVPNYVVQVLAGIFSSSNILYWLSQNIGLSSYWGVSLYIATLFGLSFVFGSINVDSEKISENLRNSGDYINGYRPGAPTRDYLQKHVSQLSFVGAVFSSLIAGAPLYLGVVYPNYSAILMLPGFLMMTVGMMLMVIEQIKAIEILHSYQELLD
ncbi:accessory Sec system protein translocase subunit SecY2 [Liquorilactobacillus aquaticus]|uniref:accessory Sec system protein translocase subunit SecY2 n=1 Tax=Liquorilactobacillus aquaticus TaxID=392566 RepID=UPI00070AC2C4|nr:accessory Sec system protein translocase subunit SecY2 [Liquorilactobacillus aquaticus]